jgi:hypothetical protein
MNKENMDLPPWLEEFYALVDFSGMRGFPHNHIYGSEVSPVFYGYGDSIVKHISTFIEYCKNINSLMRMS